MRKTKAKLMEEIATLHTLCDSLSIPIVDDNGVEIEPALILLGFVVQASRFAGTMFVELDLVKRELVTEMYDDDMQAYVRMMSAVIMSGNTERAAPAEDSDAADSDNVIPFPPK